MGDDFSGWAMSLAVVLVYIGGEEGWVEGWQDERPVDSSLLTPE